MAQAKRDQNQVTTLIAVSSSDGLTPVTVYVDPTTHRLLVDAIASGGQTPWTSDIDGGGFNLFDVGNITLNNNGFYKVLNTGAAAVNIIGLDNSNVIQVGDDSVLLNFNGRDGINFDAMGTAITSNAANFTLDTPGNLSGLNDVSAVSFNRVIITPPATGSTLTIQDGFTLLVTANATVSGTNTGDQTDIAGNAATATALQTPRTIGGVSFNGTANITVASATGGFAVTGGNLTSGGVVVPTISSTDTLTNKRITRRLTTTNAPGATPSTNTDNVDIMNFTGLATAITSMTTNLSGTPVDGNLVEFRFTDNGTARAITWGASFVATTVVLPTTTVISTMLRVLFEWNGSTWACLATC